MWGGYVGEKCGREMWGGICGGGYTGRMIYRILCIVLAISLFQIIGCGDGNSPRRADFIFAVGDEHNSLDPQKISWVVDGRIAEQMYEGLLRYDPTDLSLIPGVANTWDISDDQLTYTFHLRNDAKWSNGDPVTAHDFVYGWSRAIWPDLAADYTQLMQCIAGTKSFFEFRNEQLTQYIAQQPRDADAAKALFDEAQTHFQNTVALRATDDHTLVVTLEKPTPYFLELTAFVTFMPIHRPSIKADTTINPDTGMVQFDETYWSDGKRIVSNGPYQLTRRRFKQDVLLTANPYFHDAAAMQNQSILERIITDPQTALLAYENGELDWFNVPSANPLAADLIAQNRSDVHSTLMNGVYFYNFNCAPTFNDGTPNPLSDVRLREALSLAIDRQALVNSVTRLKQPTIQTYIPDNVVPGYTPPSAPNEAEVPHGFDPARAKQLLADAGYPNGQGLTGLSILYNTGHGHGMIAQAIARMWQQHLNVDVALEGVEVRSFSQRLKTHDYTIARASWFGDYRDPTTWLDKMSTGNGNNDCQYTNPDYDALLQQASTQLTPATRMQTLQKAEAIMLSEHPMAMIFQYINIDLYRPDRVTNLHTNAWNKLRLELVSVREESEH